MQSGRSLYLIWNWEYSRKARAGTGRLGDWETGRLGDERVYPSPSRPVSQSPSLPVPALTSLEAIKRHLLVLIDLKDCQQLGNHQQVLNLLGKIE